MSISNWAMETYVRLRSESSQQHLPSPNNANNDDDGGGGIAKRNATANENANCNNIKKKTFALGSHHPREVMHRIQTADPRSLAKDDFRSEILELLIVPAKDSSDDDVDNKSLTSLDSDSNNNNTRSKCKNQNTATWRKGKSSDSGKIMKFGFNKVFAPSATQLEVFNSIAKPKLDEIFDGINCTIFAYGQTGSGKTYSVSGGGSFQDRGLIPRCISNIFKQIKKRGDNMSFFKVKVSYLEVYMKREAGKEMVQDLLSQVDHREHSSLFEDSKYRNGAGVQIFQADKGLVLRPIREIEVNSEESAMEQYYIGTAARLTSCASDIEKAARSNTIFSILVEGHSKDDGGKTVVTSGKMNLVDLAGSGKMESANITTTSEVASINLSLHYLEQVIRSLHDENAKKSSSSSGGSNNNSNGKPNPPAHIPYRNSALTHLLRDSLGGNCKSCFLLNISTNLDCIDETIATCKFGQRCGDIKLRNICVNTAKIDDSDSSSLSGSPSTNVVDILFEKVSKMLLSMEAKEFFLAAPGDQSGAYYQNIREIIALSSSTSYNNAFSSNSPTTPTADKFDDSGTDGIGGAKLAIYISQYNQNIIQCLFESLHSIDVIRSRTLLSEWLVDESLTQHFIAKMDEKVYVLHHPLDDTFELKIINSKILDEKNAKDKNVNKYNDSDDDSSSRSSSSDDNELSLKLFIGDFVKLQSSDANYWIIKVIDDSNGLIKLSPCDDSFNEICISQERQYCDDIIEEVEGGVEDTTFDIIINAAQLIGAYILPRDAVVKPKKEKEKEKEKRNSDNDDSDDVNEEDYSGDDNDRSEDEDEEREEPKIYRIPPLATVDKAFDIIYDIFLYYQNMLHEKINLPHAMAALASDVAFSSAATITASSTTHTRPPMSIPIPVHARSSTAHHLRPNLLHNCEKMANTLNWVQRKIEINRTAKLFKDWRDEVYAIASSASPEANILKPSSMYSSSVSVKCLNIVARELRSLMCSSDVLNPLCYILRNISRGGSCGGFNITSSSSLTSSSSGKNNSKLDGAKSILFDNIYDLIDKNQFQSTWKCIRPSTNCDVDQVRRIRALIKQRRLKREAVGDASSNDSVSNSNNSSSNSDAEWEETVSRSLSSAYLAFFEPKRSLVKYYGYFDDDSNSLTGNQPSSSSRNSSGNSSRPDQEIFDRVQKVPSVLFKCERRKVNSSSSSNSSNSSSSLPFLGSEWDCQEYGGAGVAAHIQQGDILHIKNPTQSVLRPYSSHLSTTAPSILLPSTNWYYVCKIDFVLMAIVVYPVEENSPSVTSGNNHIDRLYYISVCDLWSIPVYRLFIKKSDSGDSSSRSNGGVGAPYHCSFDGDAGEQLKDDNNSEKYRPESYDQNHCTASTSSNCLSIDFSTGRCSIDTTKLLSHEREGQSATINCLVFLTPIINFNQSIKYLASLLSYVSKTLILCLGCGDYYRLIGSSNTDGGTSSSNNSNNDNTKKLEGNKENQNIDYANNKVEKKSVGKEKKENAIEKGKKVAAIPGPSTTSAVTDKMSNASYINIDKSGNAIVIDGIKVSVEEISANSFGILCKRVGQKENLRPSLRTREDLYRLSIRLTSTIAIDGGVSSSTATPSLALAASSSSSSPDSKRKSKKEGVVVGGGGGSTNAIGSNNSRRSKSNNKYNTLNTSAVATATALTSTIIFEGKSLNGRSFLVNNLQSATCYTISLSHYKQTVSTTSFSSQKQKENDLNTHSLKLNNHLLSRQTCNICTLSNSHICKAQILKFEQISETRLLVWACHRVVEVSSSKLCPEMEADPSILKIVESRIVVSKTTQNYGQGKDGDNIITAAGDWQRDNKSYSMNTQVCLSVAIPIDDEEQDKERRGFKKSRVLQIRSAIVIPSGRDNDNKKNNDYDYDRRLSAICQSEWAMTEISI